MIFRILTLFPDFFSGPLESGLVGKAVESEIITVDIVNIRDFTEDRHKRCDDYPYGGGSGMVLLPEPLIKAVESVGSSTGKVILTSASGTLLNQDLVKEFSRERDLTVICGHYEGVDQRVIDSCIDQEISIGDYILSGGEFAALVILDAVARYVPGFMSNSESLSEESFENGLLEYPQYTRPADTGGMKVPDILLSGNHKEIEKWRRLKSIEKTKRVRPDLYKKFLLELLNGE